MMANTKKIFDYFADALGSRPALFLFLLLVWGSAFLFGLIHYLSKGAGLPLFGWDARGTTIFMGGIILLILCLMVWRIANVNKILQNALLNDYLARDGQSPRPEHLEQLSATHLKGNFLERLFHIIRLSPHSLLILNAVLLFAAVSLKVTWDAFAQAHEGIFDKIVFTNMPWATALLVATFLIFNDAKVLKCLIAKYQIGEQPEHQLRHQYFDEFMQNLTAAEGKCFRLKYLDKERNKTIAEALNISESTVKTHINNINKKWDGFCEIRGLQFSLKQV